MGKKCRKTGNTNKPFVSICTPTFNRRPFIPYMIKCFEHQDYPKDKLEWIIIDDGTDKIEDLVKDIPQVKYFKYDDKMSLGKKRNLTHEFSKGEILVYMDDDDYYPPQRISHAVQTLLNNPKALCSGSSIVYIYFKHIEKMYQFGPYGPNHATAGTFAFKRELLNDHHYDDDAALAEEKAFLKNYTVPFVQLDPMKSILVFSHSHNTFDKRKLLENPDPKVCNESPKTIKEFIKEPELEDFYLNQIEELLKDYELGQPCYKPDVLQQMIEIEEERQKQLQAQQQGTIMIQMPDGTSKSLNSNQILEVLNQQQGQLKQLIEQLQIRDTQITALNKSIEERNNTIENVRELNTLLLSKKCDTSNISLEVTETMPVPRSMDSLLEEIN